MRIYSIILLSVILLSGCSWGAKNESKNTGPYPSVPLGVSTEIGLTKTPKGSSYQAKGTEPFWAVDVSPGVAVFSSPGNSTGGIVSTNYSVEEDDKGAIIVVRGIKGDFFLNLTKGECSDGMSDVKYAYKAILLVGAESLSGCANKK